MRIVMMFGVGYRAIFEGEPGKVLWSLYSPKGDLVDSRTIDPKHMRRTVTGLLTMCDVAEAKPECQHGNGWEHVADEREQCNDCGLVRVNEKLGRF